MAKSFPVGHMRVNPTTFITEVWNGSKWIDTIAQGITTNGNTYTTGITNAGTISSSSVKPSFSATERELMFEFLKQNMRVAEYRDGNGKIESVELQLRLDSGYEWESINRTRILRSKFTS